MQPPITLADNRTKRKSVINDEISETLLAQEELLRKSAYRNTTIKTDESFFDDSDMKSEYYLIIIYDKVSNTPLLSSRYYFDKSVIAKCLKGDNNSDIGLRYLSEKFNLENYNEGNIFLADRLSGNIKSSIYRQYRSNIFSLYYSEIVNNNKYCTLLLMIRKEKRDKQLSKYLNMGFVFIGSTLHKGKEHSIILRDF